MCNTDWKEWLRKSTNDSLRGVARKLGIDNSQIHREIKSGGLSADRVISIAHAYDLNVIDALLETGHIFPKDDPRGGITFEAAIERLVELHESNVPGGSQDDYDLVADQSPEEGGDPDDYQP